MKTLYLLRHAKSNWDDDTLDDHERPLAPRGVRACAALAAHFSTLPAPQIAWCSSATRAQETFALTRDQWQVDPSFEIDPALYLASPGTILRVLRQTNPAIERALVVGHNPGLQQLALELTHSGKRDARERAHQKFPTGALATVEIPTQTWELELESGTLTRFVTPRELK